MSYIVIDEGRCKGCALCTHVCPHNLVHIAEHFNVKGYQPAEYVDPANECTGCANCATMCPDLAITVYRSRKPGMAQPDLHARHQAQGSPLSNQ
jgi:2-oxoglutarate ferredoxin oxidoreductase subunit delta